MAHTFKTVATLRAQGVHLVLAIGSGAPTRPHLRAVPKVDA